MCAHIISSLHAQIAFISLKSPPVTKQLVLPGEPSKMGLEWPSLLSSHLPSCVRLPHALSLFLLRCSSEREIDLFQVSFLALPAEYVKLTRASSNCDYAEAVEIYKSVSGSCARIHNILSASETCHATPHMPQRRMRCAICDLPSFFNKNFSHFQKQYGLSFGSDDCFYAFVLCTFPQQSIV